MTDVLRDDEGNAIYLDGYAAVFGVLRSDSHRELIETAAFDHALKHPEPGLSLQFHHGGEPFVAASLATDNLWLWRDDFGLCFRAGPFEISPRNAGFLRLVAGGGVRGVSWSATVSRGKRFEIIDGEKTKVISHFDSLSHIAPVADPAFPSTGCWLSSERSDLLPPRLSKLARQWAAGRPRYDTGRAMRKMRRGTAALQGPFRSRKPIPIRARQSSRLLPAPANKPFKMQAKNGVGEIFIYDDIGEGFFTDGITAKSFADDLKALGKIRVLNIFINSPGGSVFDGVAIYNQLKRHVARKNVFIDGIAASVASVIAMAGDEINIAANGFMMIHQAWTGTVGTAEEHRAQANRLDKINDSILNTYAARTPTPENVIDDMMAATTWMNAEEAVELGFADKITEEVKLAAHFDPRKLPNAPPKLLAALRQARHQERARAGAGRAA